MRDYFGNNRGKCNHEECGVEGGQCPEYLKEEVGNNCSFCGHFPRFHKMIRGM